MKATHAGNWRNIRLLIAYDGTDFNGWQTQTNGVGIQSVIADAVSKMTLEQTVLIGAGRTDSGVHAVGQVAHFRTQCRIPAENLARGLNALLPESITIRSAAEMPLEFHSQYHAIRKRYRYIIDNSERPLPFLQRYTYHVRNKLDVDVMHLAGQQLLGTHDFRAFESHFPNRQTSIRTIQELTVQRYVQWPLELSHSAGLGPVGLTGNFVGIDVVADGFLYNMVRCIAGTLMEIGRGKWKGEDLLRILHGQDRSVAGLTAPAKGLFLIQVDYELEN